MSMQIPDSCPFCGLAVSVLASGKKCRADDGSWISFDCLTFMHEGQDPRMCQSRPCEEAERKRLTTEVDTLRTANAGLVEKVKRLEEAAGLALGYAAKGDFETADEVLAKAKGQP